MFNVTEVITEAKYVKIASIIRKNIEDGTLCAGEQIPNENILSVQFKVARNTIRDAIGLLINDNLLVREKGRGTFISSAYEKSLMKNIGLVLRGIDDPFYSSFSNDVFKGVQSAISDLGLYNMELIVVDANKSTRDFITDSKQRNISGIIIMGKFDEKFINRAGKHFPVILTGKIMPGSDCYSVTPDPMNTMALALKYLFKLGHREIAYLPSIIHHTGYQEKLDAYVEIYQQLCRKYKVKNKPVYAIGEYENVVLKIMKEHQPTAIITSSDAGVTAMNLLQKNGYRVPNDVSFMGLDDLGFADVSNPAMTVIDIDNQSIGKKAVELLDSLLKGKQVQNRIKVSCKLNIRNSTGKVRQ